MLLIANNIKWFLSCIWQCSAARHESDAAPDDNGKGGAGIVFDSFGSTIRVTSNDGPWREEIDRFEN